MKKRAILVENLVEIFGRSQLYDFARVPPSALNSDESTNKNGKVNIMCLRLLRFYDTIRLNSLQISVKTAIINWRN